MATQSAAIAKTKQDRAGNGFPVPATGDTAYEAGRKSDLFSEEELASFVADAAVQMAALSEARRAEGEDANL